MASTPSAECVWLIAGSSIFRLIDFLRRNSNAFCTVRCQLDVRHFWPLRLRIPRTLSSVVRPKNRNFPWNGCFLKNTTADDKVRCMLSRKGQKRLLSNWHATREEAFEFIRRKSISLKMDEPAISHTHSVEEGVEAIHQIYGLYRDGEEMSELFALSMARSF